MHESTSLGTIGDGNSVTERTKHMGAGLRPADWEELLLVYMHDPVDKALDIRGHEKRAARYASRALGREVDRSEIKSAAALADQLAAIAERIPMPTAGAGGERAVGLEHGRLEVRHPVSAASSTLEDLAVDEDAVLDAIDDIVHGLDSPRQRYLALWRLLPERLERRLGPAFVRQPADTRVPDHTLFHHADIASGIWGSRTGGHGGAYLSLSLGPVQPFIAAARTVRDLWSGSAILSWLTFQGLMPVLERFGPTALVFPASRGGPLMDLWLREHVGLGDRIALPSVPARCSPSIPNRFLALVPWGPDGRDGHAMAELCADAVHAAWLRLSEDVRARLDSALAALDPTWARRWREQAEQFFEVRASVVPERPLDDGYLASLVGGSDPFDTVWPDAAAVRGLATAIPAGERPGYDQTSSGRWQAQLEISARLAEARTVRHVPASRATMPSPAKCSLLGSFEQMGPDGLEDGRRFWDAAREKLNVDGVRLRAGERFSAVALCKRFAAPTTLARELDLEPRDFRFPDTATVAAADWLRDAGIEPDDVRRTGDWNGRWLHQTSRAAVEDDEAPPPREVWDRIATARKDADARPPAYYAILMMDADHMGRWLGGDLGPRVRDVLHPRMRDYYEGLGERARRGLDARRPVGPALHASISDALNNFASHVAPAVARAHAGTMIYSGGDDVLALLPARRAVACADALQKAFRGVDDESPPGLTSIDGRQFLAMGGKASMSAGIAFVHVKEDLRLALQAARKGEKKAKDCGRNALSLQFMRRSGEHAEVVLGWDLTSWFQDMVEMFAGDVTDRWVYRLRAELPTLGGEGIPEAAVGAEIRRLAKRASDSAGARTAGPNGRDAEDWWRRFAKSGRRRGRSTGDLLTDFTLTCQGASFVARGADA